MIAHVDQRAVVGHQRVARFELGHAIGAHDLPIGAARYHLAAQSRAKKFSAGDGDDAPPTLAHIAEIKRRVDGHVRREDELKGRRSFRVGHGASPSDCATGARLPIIGGTPQWSWRNMRGAPDGYPG
jgi:hypothetical protein